MPHAAAPRATPELAEAYRHCRRLARAHYENFPVASWLLPRGMRDHVAALYAFARVADDAADEDEGERPAAERHRLLDAWQAQLHRAVGERRAIADSPIHVGEPLASLRPELIVAALGNTIQVCDLPLSLVDDLLSAFRHDITTDRYGTWDELLDYCRRSATPVGRLVLRIAGYRQDSLDRASDCLCTALQLTNFWQDLARDWQKGRVYVPVADQQACQARDQDLAAGRLTREWRSALERVAERTKRLFTLARPLCDAVGGRLGFELRCTWLGGSRLLERLEQSGFDVFRARPELGARDAALIAWRAILWRRGPRRRIRHRDAEAQRPFDAGRPAEQAVRVKEQGP